ncbi:MAG: hypothetical protein M3N48_09130 [Verrucomicrobiota bacterium]|nr:hypothetical protein [Verrucomicrobiota bacterium]
MMKRALVALAGLLCLGKSLPAQSPFIAGTLLDQPSINSPWALLDRQDRFSFSTAFGSMRSSAEYLPVFNPSEPLSTAYLTPDNKSSLDRVYDLRRPSDIRFGGEIGFLYGKSSGSGFGREDKAGYIIGTVGNDHFSITAGYYRQETSFSGPRWRR